jgi:hypothetical protein
MRLAITPEYLAAYARLPRRAQRGADELLRKLMIHPPRVPRDKEPARDASPRSLRTLHVDVDHRIVASERDDVCILLWIGRRDEARRWAASKRNEADVAREALHLVDPGDVSRHAASQAEVPHALAVASDDVDLDAVVVPARISYYAYSKGIQTLRELARIPPEKLLAKPHLGRLTIAQTRAVIERRLGAAWEDLAGVTHAEETAAPDPATATRWDELRVALPEALRAAALDDFRLPARVRSYAAREGLHALGELAARSSAELLAARNFGRRSVSRLVQAVRDHMTCAGAVDDLAGQGLVEAWRALLLRMDDRWRTVLAEHSGLGGHRALLDAITAKLGRSLSTVRRFEARALAELRHERAWLAAVQARADNALQDGAVPLAALARDPWWAGIVALPQALDYFGERLLGGAVRVVKVGDQLYAARCTQSTLDEAWSAVRTGAAQIALPAPVEAFLALLDPWAPRIGVALKGVLLARLRGHLVVDGKRGTSRVVAFGVTRKAMHGAALLAALRASPRPMRTELIRERFGDVDLPSEALVLGRGLVGLERHFPNFAAWMERLVPAAIRVMERSPPERQWHPRELREALREELRIPKWLTHWHIGTLLRRSGKVRCMGRMTFVLPSAPDGQPVIVVRYELVRVLRAHGGPMPRAELVAELRRRISADANMIHVYLSRPPFLRCDQSRYGLLERDLPGGKKALTKAADHMAALLGRRGRGLATAELRAELRLLGSVYAGWTREMCVSALGSDDRFRRSAVGALGLSSWESVRIPSRRELVRQCLDKGGGRASVAAVQRRINAYYGEAPARARIAMIAKRVGAELRGKWLEPMRPK